MAFNNTEFSDHEVVAFCSDPDSSLRAIIALHSTRAGPAMGGCRIADYADTDAALTDVLRLSKGMSYKNIMANLPYGGGKAVIIANPRTEKTPAKFAAFARHVERLNGSYITGEDVGTTVADMELMRLTTAHVRGIPANGPGDPSPMTARGVFGGIRAAVSNVHGAADLDGITVCVQGLGGVGSHLACLLHEAGAKLLVADVDAARTEKAVAAFGATIVSAAECHAAKADVFAPCALGAVLNASSISEIKARIVAGAANNQLARETDGALLHTRGILYAPDFVINAGGVISTALEGPGFDPNELTDRVDRIADTLRLVFECADAERQPTSQIAVRMAEERLAAAG
jgi:leucine dehydrogenase